MHSLFIIIRIEIEMKLVKRKREALYVDKESCLKAKDDLPS
jgi:hypothetical protein